MAGTAIMKDSARLYMGLMSDFKDGGATGNAFTKLTKSIALAVAPVIVAAPAQAGDPNYKVSNASSVGELGGEAEDIDVTTLDSEAKENETGFIDNGTQDITINIVDKTAYTNLKKWQDTGANLLICQVRYSKSGKLLAANLYQGIVKNATLTEASVGGLNQVNASVQVSGAIYDVVTALSDLTPGQGTETPPSTINDAVS